jgi:hypothetical protein
MVLNDFSFLRRTSAGQISHHHPPGGMDVRVIPIPIPIPMPIHRFSHLFVRMSARIASISINLLSHIALDATLDLVCDRMYGKMAWLPARREER